MFYTVTLPATLWFFDKGKTDNRILFIDARNIFTQIDRAHREFNEAQIQNIAMISKLHRGQREDFVRLVDTYFEQGLNALLDEQSNMLKVSQDLRDYLSKHEAAEIPDLAPILGRLDHLKKQIRDYQKERDLLNLKATNQRQHALAEHIAPFFKALHAQLKGFDTLVRQHSKANPRDSKALKSSLEELHREVKAAEAAFAHIGWLQERFPKAEYEDVTGLCKLATIEEVKEQDYSLNPGRYVGVVIEEDGKAEEEFLAELADMHEEIESLNAESVHLNNIIQKNFLAIVGAEND